MTGALRPGIENRARLAQLILRAVRDEAGDSIAVTAKMNMTDGVRGGLQPSESLAAVRLLAGTGALDALQLTGGGSQEAGSSW